LAGPVVEGLRLVVLVERRRRAVRLDEGPSFSVLASCEVLGGPRGGVHERTDTVSAASPPAALMGGRCRIVDLPPVCAGKVAARVGPAPWGARGQGFPKADDLSV